VPCHRSAERGERLDHLNQAFRSRSHRAESSGLAAEPKRVQMIDARQRIMTESWPFCR